MSEPLVIIGQGMAGTKLAEEVSQRALGRYSVILVGAEPHRAYNRVLLSSLLAKEVAPGDIELKPRGWWARLGITNVFGQAVSSIDRATKSLRFENGVTLGYSKLVIATGSHAIRLPKPGMDLPGVITFRTMDDVERMLSGVAPGRPAVFAAAARESYCLVAKSFARAYLHRGRIYRPARSHLTTGD